MDLYGSANGVFDAGLIFQSRRNAWRSSTLERQNMTEPKAAFHRRHTDLDARLNEGDDRMTSIEERIESLRIDHAALKRELAENTAITRDIRDILETGRALFRLGSWVARVMARLATWIARVMTWLAPLVIAASALWSMLHVGDKK